MITAEANAATSGRSPSPTLSAPWPDGEWQSELRQVVQEVDRLLELAGVDRHEVDAALADFPLRVPRPYLARIRRGDPNDPLLRQVLPTRSENLTLPGYGTDPLNEAAATAAPGLLRKYAGRALVIVTGACAVNCRYCFRRHFPYAEHRQDAAFGALDAIAKDASISEVILSGGDPLLLADAQLARWLQRLGDIRHVARLRIHTRLPVVIPQRTTAALLDALGRARQQVVVVLHVNHANEIDADVRRAANLLGSFTVLNQSVLLRGVNDNAESLIELSERLFECGVLPYYLHLPDAVAGTAHFDVAEHRAVAIMRLVAAALPGYLVPKLVREVPDAAAKECIAYSTAQR